MLNSPLGGRRGIGFGLGRSWQRKSADWWLAGGIPAVNCVAAYQPIGAVNYAASKVNLANPGTYDAYEGVAPTWDAVNGWTGNGTYYLKTDIIPSSGWSFIVRYSNAERNTTSLFGESTNAEPNARVQIYPYFTDDKTYYRNGGQASLFAFDTSAVLCMAGNKAYRNGIDEGITIPAWSGTALSLYILGSNGGAGVVINIFIGNIQVIAFYDTQLTADQVSAVTTAIQAL